MLNANPKSNTLPLKLAPLIKKQDLGDAIVKIARKLGRVAFEKIVKVFILLLIRYVVKHLLEKSQINIVCISKSAL